MNRSTTASLALTASVLALSMPAAAQTVQTGGPPQSADDQSTVTTGETDPDILIIGTRAQNRTVATALCRST